jgi:hypothetical protein
MCEYAIVGWGSPSHVQSAMEKTREDNWKARKTSWPINQVPTLGPENDKIKVQWVLDILSKYT